MRRYSSSDDTKIFSEVERDREREWEMVKRNRARKQAEAAAKNPRPERRAGDALVALMNEPTRELGPAYEALLDKAAAFNAIDRQLVDAGVPASEFSGMQRLQVPTLSNGVPAPYVDTVSKPGVERRVHVVDEGGELYPIQDGSGYLVSEFGDGRTGRIDGFTPSPEEKATEYVAERILRLMGKDPIRGPHKGVDFQIPGEGMKGIDAQIQRGPGVTQTQLYTYLRPNNKDYAVTPEGGKQIVRDVSQMIQQDARPGEDIVDVVEALAGDRAFYDKYGNRFGKALKKDYDQVLMPEYSVEFANKNQRANDSITEPPDAIRLVDLTQALEGVRGRSPSDVLDSGDARVSWNMGNNRQGPMRARINVTTPEAAITDVVQQYPYTAQMLRELR